MRKVITVFLVLISNSLFAQYTADTSVCFGLTGYVYANNTNLDKTTSAVGPSVFLNDDKLSIQLSVLLGLKNYTVIDYTHFNSTSRKQINLFLPVLFHYRYLKTPGARYFLTIGCILGGVYYEDEENFIQRTNGVSFIAGTGATFHLLNKLFLRTSLNARFTEAVVFPGIFLEVMAAK